MVKFNKKKFKKEVSQLINIVLEQLPSHFGISNLVVSVPIYKCNRFERKATFEVKYTPQWKYGIWLNHENKKWIIFGEHLDLIDKFKPSRTYFASSILSEVIEKIEQIHKEPILCYLDSLTFNQFAVEIENYTEEEKEKTIKEKYKIHINKTVEYKKEGEKNREEIFLFLKNIPNMFEEVEVVLVDDAMIHSYLFGSRYNIYLVLNENVEDTNTFFERFDEYFYQTQKEINQKYSYPENEAELSNIFYVSPTIKKQRYHVNKKIKKTIAYKFFKTKKINK